MDTSLSVKISTKKRSTLFFGKYEFCATIRLREAFVLRHRSHAVMDKVLQNRREWGQKMSQQPGSWLWSRMDITEEESQNLHNVLDYIMSLGDSVKIMLHSDWLHLYTNDSSVGDQLIASYGKNSGQLSKAQLTGNPGAINLKRSDYQQRTYFRWSAVTLSQKNNLRTVLRNQTDIRLSPSLDAWLDSDTQLHLNDHYFVDHNDSGVLTLLALALGHIVRKTLPIKIY